jgi:hypothetical protein
LAAKCGHSTQNPKFQEKENFKNQKQESKQVKNNCKQLQNSSKGERKITKTAKNFRAQKSQSKLELFWKLFQTRNSSKFMENFLFIAENNLTTCKNCYYLNSKVGHFFK